MRLKNLNTSPSNGGFLFFFHNERLNQTDQVSANGLDTLVDKTSAQFKNLGMEVPENLREIIEHQICLRQDNPLSACWSGGFGDDLHHKWINPFLTKVADTLDKTPSFPDRATRSPRRNFTSVISKAAKAVAQTARRVASCGSCGGSRTYKQGSNNLGRAGSLNRF